MSKNKTYPLTDSPFYKLQSKKKLAEIFGFSKLKMFEILENNKSYKIAWKHKEQDIWKNIQPNSDLIDNFRPINIPHPKLKLLQARIGFLLSRCSVPDWLFSPVKGRSYVNNAAIHKNSKAFWLLDIANYFPNCSQKKSLSFF